MPATLEQNFPIGSSVVVTDRWSKFHGKPGIVEEHLSDFAVKARFASGRFCQLDVSQIRLHEGTDEADETAQDPTKETPDDTNYTGDAKTSLWAKFTEFFRRFGQIIVPSLILSGIIALTFIFEPKPEPIPPKIEKTEAMKAMERVNERNLRIAPLVDSCRELGELKRANESDLSVIFGKNGIR